MTENWFTPICEKTFKEACNKFRKKTRPLAKLLLLELLFRASRNDQIYLGIPLKRGQAPYGELQLASEIGASRHQVRWILMASEKANILAIETTHQGSIATIIDIERYLIDGNESGQQSGQQSEQQSEQQSGQRVANEWPTSGHTLNPKVESRKPVQPLATSSPAAPKPKKRHDPFMQECEVLWDSTAPPGAKFNFKVINSLKTQAATPYRDVFSWRLEYGQQVFDEFGKYAAEKNGWVMPMLIGVFEDKVWCDKAENIVLSALREVAKWKKPHQWEGDTGIVGALKKKVNQLIAKDWELADARRLRDGLKQSIEEFVKERAA